MTLLAIKDYLSSIGCSFPEIALLQPADPFLDTTGEDLRRRIFITSENSGSTLCLRPEFTIPVCLKHLDTGVTAGKYGYAGTVFRQRADGPVEFTQAGFEDLGDENRTRADISCINTAYAVLDRAGVENGNLVLGNQSIFTSLLDALSIPSAWRKKLVRAFGDNRLMRVQLTTMADGSSNGVSDLPIEMTEALQTGNFQALVDQISQKMVSTGLPLSGGRTAVAIAERLREKSELANTVLGSAARQALEEFLKIDVDLAQATSAIAEFEKTHGVKLSGAADSLEVLADGLHSGHANARFKASFGRRLDYYTGLVFEIHQEGKAQPMIGGGRYDRLLGLLGAQGEVPAVGFAVWVDRLGGAA